MQKLSVVIVCKNEAGIIGLTLESLQGLTDDIIVLDNGSTDDTPGIVERAGASLHKGEWEGFGKTKRKAANLARYDWVLSLDADEAIDAQLKNSLLSLQLREDDIVYEINFRNFLLGKFLRFGEWGGDKHIRLFNRKRVNWDDAPVHEKLVIPPGTRKQRLAGYVLHYTANDLGVYENKMANYAVLNANKYYQQGKNASWLRTRLSPAFSFLKYYIFKLGFLDGEAGYKCAKMTAHYTFQKYARLRKLNQENKK